MISNNRIDETIYNALVSETYVLLSEKFKKNAHRELFYKFQKVELSKLVENSGPGDSLTIHYEFSITLDMDYIKKEYFV